MKLLTTAVRAIAKSIAFAVDGVPNSAWRRYGPYPGIRYTLSYGEGIVVATSRSSATDIVAEVVVTHNRDPIVEDGTGHISVEAIIITGDVHWNCGSTVVVCGAVVEHEGPRLPTTARRRNIRAYQRTNMEDEIQRTRPS